MKIWLNVSMLHQIQHDSTIQVAHQWMTTTLGTWKPWWRLGIFLGELELPKMTGPCPMEEGKTEHTVVGFSEFNSGDEVRPEVDENYHFCTEGTIPWYLKNPVFRHLGKWHGNVFGISPLENFGISGNQSCLVHLTNWRTWRTMKNHHVLWFMRIYLVFHGDFIWFSILKPSKLAVFCCLLPPFSSWNSGVFGVRPGSQTCPLKTWRLLVSLSSISST